MKKEDSDEKDEIKSPYLAAESDDADDDIVEFEYNADGEEDLKKTLKKLRADLKQVKKEKEEYLTGWQKERADFANYKKGEDERNKFHREATAERIVESFLPVADSFNLAFSNREVWEKVDQNWRTGVEYIFNQLKSALEEYGVTSFGEEGEKFDPNLHESIETIETVEKSKDHTIAKVIQKGYKQGTRILRPARVNVYEYKE